MVFITKGCYAVIVGFDRPAFAVPQLIGMCRDYRSVLYAAMLAWALADNF
jgi:hypothetical protein